MGPARLEVGIAARRTAFHGVGGEPAGIFDGVRTKVEIDLVHPVARALVVDQRAGAELRDGEEAGAGDELVTPLAPAPARHVGGDRQPGEVVAGEEALRREIAVGVEVPLVDPLRFGEQADLALGLCAQPPRVVALGLRPGVVTDDRVVDLALADGGAVEAAPPVARGVEAALDAAQHLVHPSIVEPGRAFELGADLRDHRLGLRPRRVPVDGASQRVPERALHRQPPALRIIELQDRGQGSAQIRPRPFHPDRVDVRADEVAVAEIDAGRRHRAGDHPGGLAVEVLVVGAAPRAVGEDQGGLSAAPRAPAALRVVGRGGRNVAQVDEVELGDVHAELHGRRAEQQRQVSFAEALLPFQAVLRHHLGGVFARFEDAPQVHEAAVALHEVTVHFLGKPAFFEQARAVGRAALAVARQPAERVGVELVARVVAVAPAADLLDDAVALQGEEQETDDRAGVRAPEGLRSAAHGPGLVGHA